MQPDLPTHMRAAFIEQTGPPDGIRVGDLPVPAGGPTDVLVRVDAVSVNSVDTFVRSGAYHTPIPFPFVIGRDLVGTVAALGAGVVGLRVGDAVWTNSLGHAGRQGAAAEYAVVSADRLYRVPAGVDPVTLVSVVHPAASAYLALAVHGRVRAGEVVLVAGAAGHVGRAATVLAARAGARVVATARAADQDSCRALGADIVIDYTDPRLVERVRDVAPDGVDVHLDTSGNHDLDAAFGMLAQRGRIILMAGLRARPVLPVGDCYTRSAQILGFVISTASVGELAGAARRVNQLVGEGAIQPRAVEELPLSAAAEAHRRLEDRRAAGVRLILRPRLG